MVLRGTTLTKENIMHVMGHPVDYWMELKRNTDVSKEDLITENAVLRAKVSYYEDKIQAMVDFKENQDGKRKL